MPPQIPERAREAARAGRKIEAIKIVRAEMSLDLMGAKEVVDAFLASTASERDIGSGKARAGLTDTRMPQSALDAIARGEKIEAIKIVRTHFGVGLRDAKAAVERHMKAQRTSDSVHSLSDGQQMPAVKSGCSAYAVLIALGTVGFRLLVS